MKNKRMRGADRANLPELWIHLAVEGSDEIHLPSEGHMSKL